VSVALCFVEASARFDRAGGPYLYAREAFGDWVGFAIGWMSWATAVVSWAAVANGVAVYLGYFGPALASYSVVKAVAASVILGMGAINYRGVKLGAWTSNFFTAAKLLPLTLFVILGLPYLQASHLTPFAPQGFKPLGPACFLAYFAFQGFETVPVPAGEVDRPGRTVPLAVIFSLLIAALLYMLVQGVAVGIHPGLSGSQRPLADAAGLIAGNWGASIMVLGAVFSMIGYNAGTALGSPRYLVALAQGADLPEGLAALHPKFGTPALAVALTTLFALVLALFLDFNKLVDFSNIVICVQYISTCAAVPLLRRKGGTAGFRLPGGWTVPLLGIGSTLWLGAQGGAAEILWSLGILGLGLILRWATQRTKLLAAAAVFFLPLLAVGAWAGQGTEGFVLEKISAQSLGGFLKEVSREPHVAGSPANERLAQAIKEKFLSFGLEVETPSYDVLLSYPEEASVELLPEGVSILEPEGERLSPEVRALMRTEDLIAWNAYAPSGEVSAPVVYANYARPQDFESLRSLGVEVKGRIVLARYGEGYRGGKSLEAQRRGAAGILFYSDPADDGYVKGDPIPKGTWGPPDHFQRGSNVYDFIVPGDPLTPGWASTKSARRIRPDQAEILPKIPSLPLSYAAASRILSRLEGPSAPKGWQGGLAFTYHLGAGPGRLKVKIKNRLERRTIVNVLGTLRGREEPQKKVFLSSHHDAWTRGAVDDGIGTAAVLELARVFGELARQGQRPRRSIVLASWDAEEYTLTGSTEWGEEHAADLAHHLYQAGAAALRKNAVALLNIDAYRWGSEFTAVAVPALRGLILEALGQVPDPRSGKSLLEAAKLSGGPEIGIMGSGSDYTVFLNHLGVPAAETMFTGNGGVYHSIYDDVSWVERVDPGFKYLKVLTALNGLMAWRLADAELLPLDYAVYARDIGLDLEGLGKAHPELPLGTVLEAARLWQAQAELLATAPYGAEVPPPESVGKRPTAPYGAEVPPPESVGKRPTAPYGAEVAPPAAGAQPAALRCANDSLMLIERELLEEGGIPGRAWFKHLIYAPLPSYEALSLPGLREALEAGDLKRARSQAQVLEQALRRALATQRRAAHCLGFVRGPSVPPRGTKPKHEGH
jgi:N-acetylated-alpha-linked acidic dipeptidase